MEAEKAELDLNEKKVWVFFDTECVFCNKCVRFLLKNIQDDPPLIFSSQKGSYAKQKKILVTGDSIIVFSDFTSEVLTKSRAIKSILSYMRYPLKSLSFLFYIIPFSWSDWVYSIISRRRSNFFKKKKCLPVPKRYLKYFK